MARSFHDLPAELVEDILQDLTLRDKRCLRLASTQIRDLINNSSFREYFRKKRVPLTTELLEDFVKLSKTSKLICLLQELVLVGVVRFKATPPTTDGDLVLRGSLLSEALNNVRMNSQLQALHSLSLEVVTRVGEKVLTTDEALFGSLTRPCKPRPARPVWNTMLETFQLTAVALARSKMPVHELNLFKSIQRCGLACDAFDSVTDLDLSTTLKHVQKLSMRVSSPLPTPLLPTPWHPSSYAVEALDTTTTWEGKLPKYKRAVPVRQMGTFLSVQQDRAESEATRWLKQFPNLESLDIHWFDLTLHSSLPQEDSRRAFGQAVGAVYWPTLAELSLSNINISVETSQHCISSQGQLRKVILRNVRLEEPGNLNEFINWLRRKDHRVYQLHIIDSLTDRSHIPMTLRYYDSPSNPSGPPIIREHGSDMDAEWKRQQYGPPWRLD